MLRCFKACKYIYINIFPVILFFLELLHIKFNAGIFLYCGKLHSPISVIKNPLMRSYNVFFCELDAFDAFDAFDGFTHKITISYFGLYILLITLSTTL